MFRVGSCHPHRMQDFLFWFGLVANSITVIAGLIAIPGVGWAILGRARLVVAPQFFHPSVAPNLTMAVTSIGSNPVRGLELSVGLLDDNGFSMRGDGLPARPALNRGETVTVMGYDPDETKFGSEPRDGEFRWELRPGDGWFLTVQWQSPMFPWRRSSRTYEWPPARRFASELPEELAGRKEIRFLKRTRDQSLNPVSPDFVAPLGVRARAILATDETFDELVADHKGIVLVGYGPTWQGRWWEDVRRMLDAFAAKHAPRVKVLVVNTDECPTLVERFATNEVPVFKLFLRGELAKSYTGVHALPDLEREFAEFLN